MYIKQLIILTMTFAPTLRDDVGSLLLSVARACNAVACSEDSTEEASGDEEFGVTDDGQDNEPMPSPDEELPGILEIELDSEVEDGLEVEMNFYSDAIVHGSIESDRLHSHGYAFSRPVICLRI